MYSITGRQLILRDSPKRIDFHIRNDDYFAFLATLIGVLEEALAQSEEARCERALARELRHDLRYVQANYRVEPRALGDVRAVRGKGDQLRR